MKIWNAIIHARCNYMLASSNLKRPTILRLSKECYKALSLHPIFQDNRITGEPGLPMERIFGLNIVLDKGLKDSFVIEGEK